MLYRKGAALFIGLLVLSVVIFFFNLPSVKISTTCLVFCFIAVIGIRWCLAKMDEFKSLYVNTVPMIDPERDFSEEKGFHDLDDSIQESVSSVEEVMDSFVSDEESIEAIAPEDFSELAKDEVEATEEITDLTEVEATEEITDLTEVEATEEITDLTEVEVTEEITDLTEVEVSEEITDLTEVEVSEEGSPLEHENEVVSGSVEPISIEDEILLTVTQMIKTEYDLMDELTVKMVGNYFTIYTNKKVLLRCKLTGRKQYILTHLSQEEVEGLGLDFEAPSKSESYTSRVTFKSLAVLKELDSYILETYKQIHKL
ncbi:DNA polymerase III subunit epsilon [Turicibacter sanguinis]|nr:DNA polymerase III subunit epsilon [Turicibacter sanguinis]